MSESDHKYTFSGFGSADSAYWKKKAEREAAEKEKKSKETE